MNYNSKKLPYKNILFDWDGCLVQTLSIYMMAFGVTFKKYGLFHEDLVIGRHLGDWDMPLSLGISQQDFESFWQDVMDIVKVELPNVVPYPGAFDLLYKLQKQQELDQEIKIALITSSTASAINPVLSRLGLESCFDLVVDGRDVVNQKPHPESIELALSKLGGLKNQTVMIGDSSKDLGAANNAGVNSILMYPKKHVSFYVLEELKLYNPTYICTSFDELNKILLTD